MSPFIMKDPPIAIIFSQAKYSLMFVSSMPITVMAAETDAGGSDISNLISSSNSGATYYLENTLVKVLTNYRCNDII